MWAAAVEAKRRNQLAATSVDTMVTRKDMNLEGEVRHLQRVAGAYQRLTPFAVTLLNETDDSHMLPVGQRRRR